MLWYKGWLETRFRILFALGLMSFIFVLVYWRAAPSNIDGFIIGSGSMATALPVLLAGAGIATQAPVRANKGLHGSMHFTLSLPVSRLRLLAVRSGLGWLAMAAALVLWCCGLWLAFPALRAATTVPQLFAYAGVLTICNSEFYYAAVLLDTFLDEPWRAWASGLVVGAVWLLFNQAPLPASLNVFRAMESASPLATHTLPWIAIAFSLSLSAILFFAASKIARAREY